MPPRTLEEVTFCKGHGLAHRWGFLIHHLTSARTPMRNRPDLSVIVGSRIKTHVWGNPLLFQLRFIDSANLPIFVFIFDQRSALPHRGVHSRSNRCNSNTQRKFMAPTT